MEILCKRDDLTGADLSGNKIRKLEFLLADVIRQAKGGVVTCGGAQSNHTRATAIAATRLGLKCHLILFTDDPGDPPPANGNILLERLAGASIRWESTEKYHRRNDLLHDETVRLSRECGVAYEAIPEGGSNALGAWGYVRCIEELHSQLGAHPATIVFPLGSGGTAAGLLAGCSLFQLPYRLIAVSVADDLAGCRKRVTTILDAMTDRNPIDAALDFGAMEFWDGYVGLGYGISRREELQCIADTARRDGIIFDPTYTGKALYALCSELRAGRDLGTRIVFLHTGGIFGLFAKRREIECLLESSSPRTGEKS